MQLKAFARRLQQFPSGSPQGRLLTTTLEILQEIASRAARGPIRSAQGMAMLASDLRALPDSRLTDAVSNILLAMQDFKANLARALMAFGLALENAGHFALAEEVFMLVTDLGRADRDLAIVPEAWFRCAICRRHLNRWHDATEALGQALSYAKAIRDDTGVLLIGIGFAKLDLHYDRPDLARQRLKTVILNTAGSGELLAFGRAKHDLGVADLEGDRTQALDHLLESQDALIGRAARLRVLNDIGLVQHHRGELDDAVAAFTKVRQETEQCSLRWIACINLLKAEADRANWREYGLIATELQQAPLPDRLACLFRETVAYGLAKRGKRSKSVAAYKELATLAEACNFPAIRDRAVQGMSGQLA